MFTPFPPSIWIIKSLKRIDCVVCVIYFRWLLTTWFKRSVCRFECSGTVKKQSKCFWAITEVKDLIFSLVYFFLLWFLSNFVLIYWLTTEILSNSLWGLLIIQSGGLVEPLLGESFSLVIFNFFPSILWARVIQINYSRGKSVNVCRPSDSCCYNFGWICRPYLGFRKFPLVLTK